MCGYATYQDPRLAPPEEHEPTPIEWMEGCAHSAACERLWRRLVDARDYMGWADDMARSLGCGEGCEAMEA